METQSQSRSNRPTSANKSPKISSKTSESIVKVSSALLTSNPGLFNTYNKLYNNFSLIKLKKNKQAKHKNINLSMPIKPATRTSSNNSEINWEENSKKRKRQKERKQKNLNHQLNSRVLKSRKWSLKLNSSRQCSCWILSFKNRDPVLLSTNLKNMINHSLKVTNSGKFLQLDSLKLRLKVVLLLLIRRQPHSLGRIVVRWQTTIFNKSLQLVSVFPLSNLLLRVKKKSRHLK